MFEKRYLWEKKEDWGLAWELTECTLSRRCSTCPSPCTGGRNWSPRELEKKTNTSAVNRKYSIIGNTREVTRNTKSEDDPDRKQNKANEEDERSWGRNSRGEEIRLELIWQHVGTRSCRVTQSWQHSDATLLTNQQWQLRRRANRNVILVPASASQWVFSSN